MSQAIADLDDIERFAQHLQYFNDQLRQNISQLDGALGNLRVPGNINNLPKSIRRPNRWLNIF